MIDLRFPSSAMRLLGASVVAAMMAGCAEYPPPTPASGSEITAQYRIGPGDALNIFVYRNPELSVQLPVRPDGRISTPLSPDVVAVGKTPSELARAIESRLAAYVKEPSVTVMASSFAGPFARQIRVIGEIAELRALPYRANMTLLDVIIECKGLTKFAAGNRAILVRERPEGKQSFNVRLDDLIKDGDLSKNVAMEPGDTLIIPQAWY
jgi:polysaccharide export outer membrane protein